MKLVFGTPEHIKLSQNPMKKKCKETKPSGYAGKPGAGEKGKKCKTCGHLRVKRTAKNFYKCALSCKGRTILNGGGSDILISSPACQYYITSL